MGPARRVPRARPQRRRRLPLPAGGVPRRRLRGALLPAAARPPPADCRGRTSAGRRRTIPRSRSSCRCTGRERATTSARGATRSPPAARAGEVRERRRRAASTGARSRPARRLPDLDVGRGRRSLGGARRRVRAHRAATTTRSTRTARPAVRPRIPLGPQPGLLRKEGVIRERTGRYTEALRWYTRGLAAAAGLEDETERRTHRRELTLDYAGVRLRQGLFGECIKRAHAALEDALDAGDLRSAAHAYFLLHLAHTELGSPEREAFRGLALPIYEELGDLRGQANVLNNLGIEAYYEGRWDEALDLYRRSRETRERIGRRRRRGHDHEQHRRHRVGSGALRRGRAGLPRRARRVPRRGLPARQPRRDEQPRPPRRPRGPGRRGRDRPARSARGVRGAACDGPRPRDRGALGRARPLCG